MILVFTNAMLILQINASKPALTSMFYVSFKHSKPQIKLGLIFFVILLKDGPEIIEFPSPHLAFDNSHSVVLDCVVNSNPSVIAMEWFKDKYLLSNTNKYHILPNNSLLIRNVQKADKGNYYCACNNTIKKAVSSMIKLDIVDSKNVDLTYTHANSGQLFKIPCLSLVNQVTKFDSNEVKWFKINSRMPNDRFSVDLNGSLVIQGLRSFDAGVYLCRASEQLQAKLAKINAGENTYEEKAIKLSVVSSKLIKMIQNNSVICNKRHHI